MTRIRSRIIGPLLILFLIISMSNLLINNSNYKLADAQVTRINFPGQTTSNVVVLKKYELNSLIEYIWLEDELVGIRKFKRLDGFRYYFVVYDPISHITTWNITLTPVTSSDVEFTIKQLEDGSIAVYSPLLIARKVVIYSQEYPYPFEIDLDRDEASRGVTVVDKYYLVATTKKLLLYEPLQGIVASGSFSKGYLLKAYLINNQIYVFSYRRVRSGYEIWMNRYNFTISSGSLVHQGEKQILSTYKLHDKLVGIYNDTLVFIANGAKAISLRNMSNVINEINFSNSYFLTGYVTNKHVILLYHSYLKHSDYIAVYDHELNLIDEYNLKTSIFLEDPEVKLYEGVNDDYYILSIKTRRGYGYLVYLVPGKTGYMDYVMDKIVDIEVTLNGKILTIVRAVNTTYKELIILTIDKQQYIVYSDLYKHITHYTDYSESETYITFIKREVKKLKPEERERLKKKYIIYYVLVHIKISSLATLLVEGIPAFIKCTSILGSYLYTLSRVPGIIVVPSGQVGLVFVPLGRSFGSVNSYRMIKFNLSENRLNVVDVRKYLGHLIIRGIQATLEFTGIDISLYNKITFMGGEEDYYVPPGIYHVKITFEDGTSYELDLTIKANETKVLMISSPEKVSNPLEGFLENSFIYIMVIVIFIVIALLILGIMFSRGSRS